MGFWEDAMDIKKKRKELFLLTTFFYIIFFLVSYNFYYDIRENTYVGIRAYKVFDEWKVKRVLYGGEAQKYDIKEQDTIIKIDEKNPNENILLKKYLLVERVHSVTIKRNNAQRKIEFIQTYSVVDRYIITFLIGNFLFFFLYHFIQYYKNGRSETDFYSFLLLLIFALISTIPSSVGNFIGRFIVITFLSFLPFYFDRFLYFLGKKEKLNWIFLGMGMIHLLLYVLNFSFSLPQYVVEYLAIGIFYYVIISCILIFTIVSLRTRKNRKEKSRTFLLFTILSMFPLLFGYIFPLRWEVPFYIVTPFLMFPMIGLLHFLILSKRSSYRYPLTRKMVFVFFSIVFSIFVFLILLLNEYIPTYILVIYTFFYLLLFFPIVEEILLFAKDKKKEPSLDLFSAVENERENIALYIHDSIIQDVIYEMKKLETKGKWIERQEVIETLEEVVFYLRELCSDIYPLMIQEIGLKNTLIAMIHQMEKKYPVQIICKINVEQIDLSTQKNNFILRSIKELMNNSILHGKATDITFTVDKNQNFYVFIVEDNGKFLERTNDNGKHFGIDIIKEKLKLLGGSLVIEKGNGTKVICYIK